MKRTGSTTGSTTGGTTGSGVRALLAGALASALLGGCAQLPATSAPAAGDRAPLVVEPVQATRVVAAASEVLRAGADPATGDPQALAARVTGPELDLRTAARTVAAAGATPAATGGADDFEAITSVLPRSAQWPRWFATVSAGGADQLPSVVVFRSGSAREPFKVWATPSLLPGVSLPTLAAPADGVAAVAVDEGTNLPMSPQEVADRYGDVLTRGADSEFAGQFAPDGYRSGVADSVARERSSIEAGGGTFTQERTVLADGVLGVRTRDGGALVVAGYRWSTTLDGPPDGISGRLDPVLAALAGREQALGASVVREEVVVFSVPPGEAGSGRTVAVVAAQSGLVSAQAR
ncbi:hypothetical protein [Kineococcus sp. SYSU DK006]|uniref:hypothetical protein n=1 Tax=Kineococcus sp. SYSU DK006 TaxID=3383127 RepID=UPI003D7DE689